MAEKTYLIQWLFLLHKIATYGAKHIGVMAANITPAQLACVQEVLTTISTCITAFGSRPVE